MIGLTTPVCGVRNFGEYPETQAGMRLANFAHLSAILRGKDYGADFLVMHKERLPAEAIQKAKGLRLIQHLGQDHRGRRPDRG